MSVLFSDKVYPLVRKTKGRRLQSLVHKSWGNLPAAWASRVDPPVPRRILTPARLPPGWGWGC